MDCSKIWAVPMAMPGETGIPLKVLPLERTGRIAVLLLSRFSVRIFFFLVFIEIFLNELFQFTHQIITILPTNGYGYRGSLGCCQHQNSHDAFPIDNLTILLYIHI